ncbi:MAG: glycosyltransferase family 4 protein [Verrucomicrobia bacterium]|nr:glycosyltransferase family 4 protein [Verrucomicrobiota bacterium]
MKPRNLRILLVVEPGWTGVFRHVEGLADFLHESGQSVALAYSNVRGSDGLEALVRRVISWGGPVRNLRVSHSPSPWDLRALLRIASIQREFQPDVIHGHSSKAGALVRLPALIRPSRASLFYTPNAYYGMARQGGIAEWFFTSIERRLANVGATINISQDEATFARDILGLRRENQFIIHNPAKVDFFLPATSQEKRESRQALGIPEDCLVLGTAGRISFEKDPETLFRALAPLFRAHPRLRLLHMISGKPDTKLARLAKSLGVEDKIQPLPYQEDLRAAYHALDGFVMTSRYEAGWPIVILEALSCGLPIVSSTGPGMSDIGHAGLSHCWTAGVEDVPGFTRALQDWLEDLPRHRPSNHREVAVGRFSPSKCLGAVLAAYRHRVLPPQKRA